MHHALFSVVLVQHQHDTTHHHSVKRFAPGLGLFWWWKWNLFGTRFFDLPGYIPDGSWEAKVVEAIFRQSHPSVAFVRNQQCGRN